MLYKQNQHRQTKTMWIMNDNRNPVANKKRKENTLNIINWLIDTMIECYINKTNIHFFIKKVVYIVTIHTIDVN